MKTYLPLLAVATLLAFGTGNAQVPAPARPTAAGPTTITALAQQWTEAMQQHNMDKAMACLSKNVRYLVNGYPLVSGRDSVSTYWLKRSFSNTSNLKSMPLQMSSDGTTGYGTGYYTYDVKPMANLPKGATGRGSYMIASRKEGAIWQFTYIHLAEDPIQANK